MSFISILTKTTCKSVNLLLETAMELSFTGKFTLRLTMSTENFLLISEYKYVNSYSLLILIYFCSISFPEDQFVTDDLTEDEFTKLQNNINEKCSDGELLLTEEEALGMKT